jgi:exonuclease III
VRILTVNLRAGGNSVTIPQIVRRASRRDVDAIVFSEYRDNDSGALLRAEAERAGLRYQASAPAQRGNGVLVVAAEPFAAFANPFGLGDDEYPNAVLKVRLGGLHVYGVYLPGQDRKRPHLRCLIAAAKYHNEAGDSAICIGDMNSGRNETDIEINVRSGKIRDSFSTADLYQELEMYWTEAWAYTHPDEYEFSWYPFRRDADYRSRAGWRIDKAFLSPELLPRLRAAEYDHVLRLDRLSDHSGLLIELARS